MKIMNFIDSDIVLQYLILENEQFKLTNISDNEITLDLSYSKPILIDRLKIIYTSLKNSYEPIKDNPMFFSISEDYRKNLELIEDFLHRLGQNISEI